MLKRAIDTQNPDWSELKSMMDTLLDHTEREMVNKAIITSVEAQIACGSIQGTVAEFFPLDNPGWDPNVPDQMARLK